MSEMDFEFWYRIERYEWAKREGLLDELFPVIGRWDTITRTNNDKV